MESSQRPCETRPLIYRCAKLHQGGVNQCWGRLCPWWSPRAYGFKAPVLEEVTVSESIDQSVCWGPWWELCTLVGLSSGDPLWAIVAPHLAACCRVCAQEVAGVAWGPRQDPSHTLQVGLLCPPVPWQQGPHLWLLPHPTWTDLAVGHGWTGLQFLAYPPQPRTSLSVGNFVSLEVILVSTLAFPDLTPTREGRPVLFP